MLKITHPSCDDRPIFSLIEDHLEQQSNQRITIGVII